MADSTISALSSASTVDGTEVLPVDQSGSTKKVAIADLTPGLHEFVGDGGSPASAKGLVPAAAAGDAAAGKFLKADGTFAIPSASITTLTTKGDILTRDSSGLARLGIGSDGQVLTADSGQTLGVKWAAAGGGMVKISKVVTTGSASTITFSSIPNTYTDLKIIITGRDTATASDTNTISLKINSDGTSGNYTSNTYLLGNGSAASSGTLAASTAGGVCGNIPGSLNNANAVGSVEIIIGNYAGTTFHKIVRGFTIEAFGSGPTIFIAPQGFVWKSTSAITDLVIKAGGTAFVDGTTATLYGLG